MNSKKVLLTGGEKEFRRSIFTWLSEQGYSLFSCFEKESVELNRLSLDIASKNGFFKLIQADFSCSHTADSFLMTFFKQHSGITLVINLDAVFKPRVKSECVLDSVDEFFTMPCVSPIRVHQQAISAGVVHIINIVNDRNNSFTDQVMSTQGLHDFTQHAAQLFSPHVRINGVQVTQSSDDKNVIAGLDFLIHNAGVTGEVLKIKGETDELW